MRSETPLDIMRKTLRCERASRLPVAPHWWGLWKYEALGLRLPQAAWREGSSLSEVYDGFYRSFRPDWLHLHIGTPRWFRGASIVERGATRRLVIDPSQTALKGADRYFSSESDSDEEIVDFADYLLGSRVRRPKVDLSHPAAVDEYVKRWIRMSAEEIEGQGYADHVAPIVRDHGREAFVAVHIPSAICEIFDPHTGYVGFEEGLIAFHDQPEGMRRLIERCYAEQLEWARAYARAGAHGFVISESYISPDLASPSIYRTYLKGVHREYFAEIERMGLVPLCMFWGDLKPVLDDLVEVGIRGLLVEESKKGFALDIASIRERLDGRMAVFGNVDSLELLHSGEPEEIAREVRRQARGVAKGFVTANGSPITPGTPEANVRALIDAGRSVGSEAP